MSDNTSTSEQVKIHTEISFSGKSEQAYDIDKMVEMFLSWDLPKDFNPDSGIEFTKPEDLFPMVKNPNELWPTGTNLFDARQAEEMIRHLLGYESSVSDS